MKKHKREKNSKVVRVALGLLAGAAVRKEQTKRPCLDTKALERGLKNSEEFETLKFVILNFRNNQLEI